VPWPRVARRSCAGRLGDAQLDRCDAGGGEPLGAQPQGGVHARVGEVVARARLENHARQLPVRAQAADDGVRVGAVAAERLQEPEAALQHGRRAGEHVPGQVGRCHAAARGPAAVDPLDGPAGAVASSRPAPMLAAMPTAEAIPALSCPCTSRADHARRTPSCAAPRRSRARYSRTASSSNDPTNQRAVISKSRDTPIHRSSLFLASAIYRQLCIAGMHKRRPATPHATNRHMSITTMHN